MIEVIKDVMSFSDFTIGKKTWYEQANFLASDYDKQKVTRKIIIQANPKTPPRLIRSLQISMEKISFKISFFAITKILNQLISFTNDPIQVSEHLKSLNDTLREAMDRNNFPPQQDNSPAYLIEGLGIFVPGPPPEDYRPLKKSRLLDSILLEREMKEGINKLGFSLKLIGLIKDTTTNTIVRNAQLYGENQQITRLHEHGSHTHRIMMEAIRKAIEAGKIDLTISKGVKLTFPQLLELLVAARITTKSQTLTAWDYIMDSVGDTYTCSMNYPYDSSKYSTSFRSAETMNSILLCFGKELGLPDLQLYLLDNYYKETYKIVHRARQKLVLQYNLKTPISNEDLYIKCMNIIATLNTNFESLEPFSFFNPPAMEVILNPHYEKNPLMPGVVKRKPNTESKIGSYDGWAGFFSKLDSRSKSSIILPNNDVSSALMGRMRFK